MMAEAGSRRRRPTHSQDAGSDYYDESDEEAGKHHKDHHVYKGACPLGRFCLNPCLCLVEAALACWRQSPLASVRQRWRLWPSASRTRNFVGGFLVAALLFTLPLSRKESNRSSLRHSSDQSLERMSVVIKALDFSLVKGVGGWLHPKKFPSLSSLEPLEHPKIFDFGGLTFKSLREASSHQFRREIASDDYLAYELYKKKLALKMDQEFIGKYYDHDDETIDLSCRRPNWKSLFLPNCNIFHEVDLTREYDPEVQPASDLNYDSYIFNHGYYRDVWMLINPTIPEHVVLKMLRMEHNYTIKTTYQIQRDAIIMERLTSSPRIVNIYGHCGSSVTVQTIPYDVEEYVIPGTGMMQQKDLHDEDDVKPQNNFTPSEKLEMALQMAESIADLHGYPGGIIVHGDIQLCQWLRSGKDKLILGDFNRAEIMSWNEKKEMYCTYQAGGSYGNYRAPEENRDDYLDEKIDVYSFGNNIYGLLTGLWVFYDTDDDEAVQSKVNAGKRAFIDERYRTRSYAEGKLVELMEHCWFDDPAKRVDIFEAVRFLREAVKQNKNLTALHS